MKKYLFFLAKLSVSILLIIYIFSKTNLSAIWETLKTTNFLILILAFLLQIIGFIICAYRWKMLLKIQGVEARAGRLFLSYLVGQFFNFFLPTTVGGDLFRIYDTRAISQGAAKSAMIIFIERLTGLFALFVIAVVASLLAPQWLGQVPGIWAMILLFVVSLGMIIFIFASPQIFSLLRFFEKLKFLPQKIKNLITQVSEVIQNFHANWKAFLNPLLLAFLLQLNVAIHVYFVAQAVKIHLPVYYFFVLVPIIQVLLMIPVSFGGIGLSENIYAFFLSRLGVPIYQAVALSLLALFLRLFIGTSAVIVYNLGLGTGTSVPRKQ